MSDLPRRIYVEKMTPAELAIRAAVHEVEKAGAHPLLTQAVMLLGEAKERVADYVDMSPDERAAPQCTCCGDPSCCGCPSKCQRCPLHGEPQYRVRRAEDDTRRAKP